MNAEDIDKLEAGRDLDALIAEHVFGWVWTVGGNPYDPSVPVTRHVSDPDIFAGCSFAWDGKGNIPIDNELGMFPEYSTDIAAAWLVVEKMREMQRTITLSTLGVLPDTLRWGCNVLRGVRRLEAIAQAEADTAPLVICRAALKALRAQQEPEGAGK